MTDKMMQSKFESDRVRDSDLRYIYKTWFNL